MNPPVRPSLWSVSRLVRRSACHNFLKGREVTLPCSQRSTGFIERKSFTFLDLFDLVYFCSFIYPTSKFLVVLSHTLGAGGAGTAAVPVPAATASSLILAPRDIFNINMIFKKNWLIDDKLNILKVWKRYLFLELEDR